jgi:hypothetical protein
MQIRREVFICAFSGMSVAELENGVGGYQQIGKEATMLTTILLIVLILLLVGALPTYPYSRTWGYGPSGGIGLVLLILLILVLLGRI